MIHPTAIVAPEATLGTNVRIGPYAIVGPEVTLGDDVEIGAHAILEGRVVLAARVRIGHGAAIGGDPQDLKFKSGTPSGVRVGEGTVIREYATIHRATAPEGWTEIGSGCLIMATSHIGHDSRLGDHVIVMNYAGITGHCDVGDRATLGGYAGLIPFCRVGTLAYIGGCSKVNQDVPPYMLVDGNVATVRGVNVIGLRRAGVGPAERHALRQAHKIFFRSGLTPAAALECMRRESDPTPQVKELIAFIETARHGVLGPPRGAEQLDVQDEV